MKLHAGTRHQFLGKLLERRPSYRVLGVLMTVQLATSAAFWGLSHSLPALKLFGSDDEHHHLAARELRVASVLEVVSHSALVTRGSVFCVRQSVKRETALTGGEIRATAETVRTPLSALPVSTGLPDGDALRPCLLLGLHLSLGQPEARVPTM